MAKKRPLRHMHMWVGVSVLLGTAIYAIAEDLTLVTYYPSPRGVYNELRTRGNVQIGSITAPADPSTAPRLHVVGSADVTQVLITANATQSNTNPLLRAFTSDGTTELFRLHSDSAFNLFLGNNAGQSNTVTGVFTQGDYNTFIGSGAGFSNTRGEENTAAGSLALSSNTTGWRNTAVGFRALESNTTGGANTAMGRRALRANTSGGGNTATGENTLRVNTTGDLNAAIGAGALEYNTTGDNNVAAGSYALSVNSTGTFNTATGGGALASNTTGSNNTATGAGALSSNTADSSNNIAMGYRAGDNITTGSNNIVIGYDIDAPSATGSNQLTIGNLIFGTGIDGTGTTLSTGGVGIGTSNPGTAKLAVMGGNVGIGTTAPAQKLHLSGSGTGTDLARIRVASTDNQAGIGFLSDNIGEVVVYSPDATNDLRIWLGGADRLSVTSTGNVGIGTTNPGALLHAQSRGATVPAGLFEKTVPSAFPTLIVRAAGGAGLAVRVEGNLDVTGTITSGAPKAFRIAHPLRPADSDLIHAAIEGPEAGVYYRGEAALVDGTAMVALPTYFEALTRPEGRTVLVTPKFSADEPVSALAVSAVENGSFRVKAIDAANPAQAFSWEVKAVRADVPPLEVEVEKVTSDQ